jgi:hypothetical protein
MKDQAVSRTIQSIRYTWMDDRSEKRNKWGDNYDNSMVPRSHGESTP